MTHILRLAHDVLGDAQDDAVSHQLRVLLRLALGRHHLLRRSHLLTLPEHIVGLLVMMMDGDIVGRTQHVERLDPSDADDPVALLVGGQPDHRLLRHALAVDLLSLLLGLTSDPIASTAALELLLLLLLLRVEAVIGVALVRLQESIDGVLDLVTLAYLRVHLLLLEVL